MVVTIETPSRHTVAVLDYNTWAKGPIVRSNRDHIAHPKSLELRVTCWT